MTAQQDAQRNGRATLQPNREPGDSSVSRSCLTRP